MVIRMEKKQGASQKKVEAIPDPMTSAKSVAIRASSITIQRGKEAILASDERLFGPGPYDGQSQFTSHLLQLHGD